MGNFYVKLYSKIFCGASGTFSTRCTWCNDGRIPAVSLVQMDKPIICKGWSHVGRDWKICSVDLYQISTQVHNKTIVKEGKLYRGNYTTTMAK